MRPLLPLLVLLAAGCVGQPVEPGAAVEAPAALPEGVSVHRAGAALAPDALAQPVAALLHGIGAGALEPTVGVDAEGRVFYAAFEPTPTGGIAPLVLRSVDGGASWEDVSPRLGPVLLPPATNDPYLYLDPATGRVFQFAMAPILVCSVLSWSDDAGGSWTTNPRGCGNTPPWDHQAMVAAPPTAGVSTSGYPNVLVQCVNNFYLTSCSRSLDGGLVWTPLAPVVVSADCGGLHGHPVAHADGTLYLPKMACGEPLVYVSRDSGASWEEVQVSDTPGHPWPDPAMAVDLAGNVYYAWIGETGELLLSRSVDGGASWSAPVVASPPGVTAHLPAMAAGADGRVVLAYPGTPDLARGYESPVEDAGAAAWHAYLTLATDALAESPTFVTVRATPADDPLVRGVCGPERCPGMIDFIDVVVGPDGRPYAAFVDVCGPECAADPKGENDQNEGLLVTLAEGPRLL